jgi:ammonia channel protein AmtB
MISTLVTHHAPSMIFTGCVGIYHASRFVSEFSISTRSPCLSLTLTHHCRIGFAMICAGCVREKNIQNTLLKNLLDACGAALAFWSMGYAIAYGSRSSSGTTFIGTTNFLLYNLNDYAFWFFEFAFAATTTTIVAGTLAERSQMVAYFLYSILLTAFIYPVVVHSLWSSHGFLSPKNPNPLMGSGAVDFAGSGVVHVTGGICALIAVSILGPRTGRFYDETGKVIPNPVRVKGSSVSLQVCLGMLNGKINLCYYIEPCMYLCLLFRRCWEHFCYGLVGMDSTVEVH